MSKQNGQTHHHCPHPANAPFTFPPGAPPDQAAGLAFPQLCCRCEWTGVEIIGNFTDDADEANRAHGPRVRFKQVDRVARPHPTLLIPAGHG